MYEFTSGAKSSERASDGERLMRKPYNDSRYTWWMLIAAYLLALACGATGGFVGWPRWMVE